MYVTVWLRMLNVCSVAHGALRWNPESVVCPTMLPEMSTCTFDSPVSCA